MTKFFILLVTLLPISMQAQELLGHWECKESKSDDSIIQVLNFQENKDLSISIYGEITIKDIMHAKFHSQDMAKYVMLGNELKIEMKELDKSVSIDKIEYIGKNASYAKDKSIRRKMDDIVVTEIKKLKVSVIKDLNQDNLQIVCLDENKLVLQIANKKVEYHRK